MRKIAMLQSNYIPWKGVFDLIHAVDVFVFYDDVQFTKRDWRTRNIIPTRGGDLWLSVPVITKNRFDQRICDVEIDRSDNWQSKHHKTLSLTYAKAPHSARYRQLLDDFYLARQWENLSEMNQYMTQYICRELGIAVEFHNAADLGCAGGKEGGKVLEICRKLECDWFLNGPAAKEFMDEELFRKAGVSLNYIEYNYPEYPQLVKPFNHYVSVLDLLMNTGPDAPRYIWGP